MSTASKTKRISARFLFMVSTALLIFATSAQASPYNFICKEKSEQSYGPIKTLTVKQLSHKDIKENQTFLVLVNLWNTDGEKFIDNEKMYASYEDVVFGFENKELGVTATIYLDELDTAYLYMDEQKTLFDCR